MKILFLFFLLFSLPAYAEKAPIKIPTPELSSLKHTKSGRIDKIIDGLTILLKDKTIIRLASLDIPDFHIWRDAPHSDDALKLLQEILPEDTEVMVYQTVTAKKGRLNRMNHELAHLVTKKDPDKDPIWINGALLSHGIARVMMDPTAPDMAEQLLSAEEEARQAKRGIWSEESEYKVLTPETAQKAMGEFAVIEGRVEKAASVRNDVYLNFGKDWKSDFTIMITPALRKKLAHKGIQAQALSGEIIRVRGWLREYNGPLIELDMIEHLSILSNNSEAPEQMQEIPHIQSE